MCDHPDYKYSQPLTVGGPTGDYEIACPVQSCKYAEWTVMGVANGDAGISAVIVSGIDAPKTALDYVGNKTLTKDAFIQGVPYRLPATATYYPDASNYFQVVNSQKKIFVRIDSVASNSAYITIRFRWMPLTVIPGPALAVHPDHAQQMNIARADKINDHLDKMGIPKSIEGAHHG